MTPKLIKFALATGALAAAAVALAFAGEWQWSGACALGAAFVARDIPSAVKR